MPTLSLQIETAGTCNAACHFCTYPSVAKTRAGKLMPEWLFQKIIDEAVTISVIDNVKLMGLNEPLLDIRLEKLLQYVKSVRRDWKTCIYTNGLLLTPKRVASLRDAGLDVVVVSLNAVGPEQHEKIMGMKGKYHTICANIDNALSSGVHTEVHAVYTSDTFTAQDVKDFYARWGDALSGGHGLVARYANWSGDIDIPAKASGIVLANSWCHRSTGSIYVTFEGHVTTCCMDPLGKQVFGDLKTQTIREVYNGNRYLDFRKAHCADRADEYELCRNCTRI